VPIPSAVDFLPPVPKVKFDYEFLKVGLRWYEACDNCERHAVWNKLTADLATLVAVVNALKHLVDKAVEDRMWWKNAALYYERRYEDLNMSMEVDKGSEVEMVTDIDTSEPETDVESKSELKPSELGSMPNLESGDDAEDD
jgi:hypothetical protein